MELTIIIILLLTALIISLILNLSYFKRLGSLTESLNAQDKKFKVEPGKDTLDITIIGFDNDEAKEAEKEHRQPQVRILTKFSLKTITSKDQATKLVAIPSGLLISKEFEDLFPSQPILKDVITESPPMPENVVIPHPIGWPPTVTSIDIQTC